MQQDQQKKAQKDTEFFTDYGDANRYKILEVIGKGSYGVVCAAIDTHTGEKVAIKKITDIFQHMSDAIRILREVKLLRLLRHPDIVEIKRIMLPPSKRDFKDIYVVFELMESDLHQVIKANDDLTREHHQFFLYQMLRALKYMHTANVYHRDLKPKNILANANCKLKICDFGLARVAFNDAPTTIFWTDYVATRWYRAPELCGSFFSKLLGNKFQHHLCALIQAMFLRRIELSWKLMFLVLQYTPAIDIWGIGCIFAEVLTGKPLFPGKSVVHQLDLITDLLGTPPLDVIAGVRNEKARKYLTDMRKKQPVPFSQKFPNADPLALRLLQKLLAFDPKDRPTAEEALTDRYFKGLSKVEREPACQPISKLEFEFERRRVTKDDVKELIYREILEYHPQLLKDYMNGNEGMNFIYPSAIGQFKKQFAHLEENSGRSGPVIPLERKHVSLPRSTVHSSTIPPKPQPIASSFRDPQVKGEMRAAESYGIVSTSVRQPPRAPAAARPGRAMGPVVPFETGKTARDGHDPRMGMRNPVLTPPHTIPPQYYYRQNVTPSQGKPMAQAKQQLQHVQSTQEVAIDMNTNPYSTNTKPEHRSSRIVLDAKLMQAQSQFGASAVAMAAHRNVGTVHYGMS
ncbi:hypothetical protein KSS87_017246 [Heliosperma pusillum]|nr:hypothetical protein KSS87_017246 [Heliosperma pusillum]